MTTIQQVEARNLAGNSRVLLDGDPNPWTVVSRSNQYASYVEKRGYYMGPKRPDGTHPGRTPGVHYLPEGDVTHVLVEVERGNARNLLNVAPDDVFEVIS